MSDADRYLEKISKQKETTIEIWRRFCIRALLLIGGCLCVGSGCLEVAIKGGDNVSGLLFMIAGLIGILVAFKPRGGEEG